MLDTSDQVFYFACADLGPRKVQWGLIPKRLFGSAEPNDGGIAVSFEEAKAALKQSRYAQQSLGFLRRKAVFFFAARERAFGNSNNTGSVWN